MALTPDSDEKCRTCPKCGADCPPEVFDVEGSTRISFACPEHDMHVIVAPFPRA
jgi:uncharacterized radical SAM superfamily Fe-S cluster-containing enzyme